MSNERTPLLSRSSYGGDDFFSDPHRQFCMLVGVPPSVPDPSGSTKNGSSFSPSKKSLYVRATRQLQKQRFTYYFTASLSNTLLLSQVVLGAALTALGASESSHVLITLFGALNTVIAGLVAYLKSRGQPMRARMYRDDLERVVDEIENSEIMWLGITRRVHGYDEINTDDHQVTVRSEVARLTRLFDRAVRTNTANNPDMYMAGSAGIYDPMNTALRPRPAVVQVPGASSAVPISLPVGSGAQPAIAAPVVTVDPGTGTAAGGVAVPVPVPPQQTLDPDPDESPATAAKPMPVKEEPKEEPKKQQTQQEEGKKEADKGKDKDEEPTDDEDGAKDSVNDRDGHARKEIHEGTASDADRDDTEPKEKGQSHHDKKDDGQADKQNSSGKEQRDDTTPADRRGQSKAREKEKDTSESEDDGSSSTKRGNGKSSSSTSPSSPSSPRSSSTSPPSGLKDKDSGSYTTPESRSHSSPPPPSPPAQQPQPQPQFDPDASPATDPNVPRKKLPPAPT
ncbi:hypothetical protein A1O1_06190 [Capronia coronata CBS 617.96]|uniref:SMODS and SLOG-associating 2TM effector domain-containing protein n=1 Tax=Capronia coronata CBS 617.96 TaxID=1182541 RepID=W9Y998_9EURO|nr:uncharacterized protein A1O1_06190 [Capronia coronata CBS 617.96]EXJ85821.1 hypothetical protein A1O1_06190 [Capronia coronata CBS 617.96]